MPRSIEDYARELIGAQAMQIISLRAQLDNALEKIKQLMNEASVQGAAHPTSSSDSSSSSSSSNSNSNSLTESK